MNINSLAENSSELGFYEVGKRLMDIFGAIVGIILFSPLMIIVALWIKIVSSGGPVLADTKKRVGKHNTEFTMFKFRSMITNAEDWLKNHPDIYKKYQENSYKLDPDPRIIKGGKFLRTSSIDELPQFFNILFGDMSLVGPRAYFRFELNEQLQRFPQVEDDLKIALTTKPGLTGAWQIGGRSKIGFVDRIKMDAKYAKKKSLLYDLMIVLKTPYVVLTKKGAI